MGSFFAQPIGINGVLGQSPQNTTNQSQGTSDISPMFGRPVWTYVTVNKGPQMGPQPKLAQGTGKTGGGGGGTAGQLPGFVGENDYFPTQFAYQPQNQPSFRKAIPRTIGVGDDGISMQGTYRAHDFTPGTRMFNQYRQAATWQVQEFPPNFRLLLYRQQVQVYRLRSRIEQARVLDSSNYFLGYQVQPQVAANIGGSTMGGM